LEDRVQIRTQELKAARELAMRVRLPGEVADDRRNPLGTKNPPLRWPSVKSAVNGLLKKTAISLIYLI